MKLAPIVLFAYKRPNELRQTIKALLDNHLASESELYVFVDGPRYAIDEPKVAATQAVLDGITGFKSIHRFDRPHNMGCADSIITGVSSVLEQHSSVIVVEDDIITSPNFLDFMNLCLQKYAPYPKVFSIGGYTFPFQKPTGYTDDAYFFGRTCAWGWGIWADRWNKTDWTLTDFETFINDSTAKKAFNQGGSDRSRMLRRAYTKKIDTWDIRLCYAQFLYQGLTVYPTCSKTTNIGVDSIDSTTGVVYNRYGTPLDNGHQRTFVLPEAVMVHDEYARQFRQKFSIPVRAWNKLRTYAQQLTAW